MASCDPLDINFLKQSRALLHSIPRDIPLSPACASILASIERLVTAEPADPAPILSQLSDALAIPALTWLVARSFRPLLVDLAARWLDSKPRFTWERLFCVAYLLEVQEELYPILLSLLNDMPSGTSMLLSAMGKAMPVPPVEHYHAVLLSFYRLLSANANLSSRLNLSNEVLRSLMDSHPDRGIRLLAVLCLAVQGRFGDAERNELLISSLGSHAELDALVHLEGVYGNGQTSNRSLWLDGWVLPLFERRRILALRSALCEISNFYEWDHADESRGRRISAEDLCRRSVSVSGVILLRQPTSVDTISSGERHEFIVTESARQTLRDLALHYSQRIPCLLSSSPAAGKTTLLQHLAHLVHGSASHVVSIHLADSSIDAKSLLGTYVSSPTVPGTFDWVDGPVVRAMKLGKWLVLEDIDRAGQDVLSYLIPLLESMGPRRQIGSCPWIDVPGRGRVSATEDFMIFSTRSVAALPSLAGMPSSSRLFPTPTFFGHQHLSEVTLPLPTMEELPMIVKGVFPSLDEDAIPLILRLWVAAREAVAQLRSDAKEVDLLGLLRLCRRICGLSSVSSELRRTASISQSVSEGIFLEALDVFLAHAHEPLQGGRHKEAVDRIARVLDLSEERVKWILTQRTPELRASDGTKANFILIGRVRSHRDSRHPARRPPSKPFALHRPSLRLVEQIAASVQANEPVLLVGETGTGKTSAVQHLASLLERPLTALNLSTQTETVDILGGLKPVDPRMPATGLQERFLALFANTFSRKRNAVFVDSARKAFIQGKWLRLISLWRETSKLAMQRLNQQKSSGHEEDAEPQGSAKRTKRRRVEEPVQGISDKEGSWRQFLHDVAEFELQHLDPKARFVFSFVEGPLIAALKQGEWILLDEINLATSDVLESLLSILEGPGGSITLTERGDLQPVPRHPSFRLFACMNPATDVGKKDLPPRLRRHFTEIYVPPPEEDSSALLAVAEQYLGGHTLHDRSSLMDVCDLYLAMKTLASTGQLADGANQTPHYNMRTLTRAMTYAVLQSSAFGLRRALYEGFLMCFTMSLDRPSFAVARQLVEKHILGKIKNIRSLLRQLPPVPDDTHTSEFAPYYIRKGPVPIPLEAGHYILTPSVRSKLLDLARIVAAGGLPVLIQGPTSSGKTSSIEYLARRTGHQFVRINNHEHTDIQEYLGSYVSDPITGKLVYRDGLLVRALRNGDWIVLDELNLAPSDVLEALNRLLDDNRELVIPETGEVVQPHSGFALFATQNPPGLYGGRKPLSRAFRNRFVEVHFEDVPEGELEVILCERCSIAPSYATRIVAVFRELQRRRQASRIFETKQSFATLRDLFRWANRGSDSVQKLAEDGYMLLAERARLADDKETVRQVLEDVLRVTVDAASLYDGARIPELGNHNLILTSATKRLWTLVSEGIRHNEPILLIGETGTGKTTICDVMATLEGKSMYAVNCHLNTETSDLIGGLRPVRDRANKRTRILASLKREMAEAGLHTAEDIVSAEDMLQALRNHFALVPSRAAFFASLEQEWIQTQAFVEWKNGPLVEAMQQGAFFLLDEISLADDAVLERVNSVLEPSRSLVLAEMGGSDLEKLNIIAEPGFQFLATMNPGGDYGKKELSPALRNRFTEIYVPAVQDRSDRHLVIADSWATVELRPYTEPLVDFWDWIDSSLAGKVPFGLRDILAWIQFMNKMSVQPLRGLTLAALFHHAARMTVVDALGLIRTSSAEGSAGSELASRAISKLSELVPLDADDLASFMPAVRDDPAEFGIGPFSLSKGPVPVKPAGYTLVAPTTKENAFRVVRAVQLKKPILLEGSPGVGKTSLIIALASVAGRQICRINLSDQTELTDLFGSDLPVEDGQPGEFGWKSAPFLRSMECGDWVLLDEMNLAPQPVLEGLNAVLDHRSQVYIPELGRTFGCHPDFRVFAAQNPVHEGGDRKGLPKSFLNRFTRVHMAELNEEDYVLVCQHLHPEVPQQHLRQLTRFNLRMSAETAGPGLFSNEGLPWDFNLRDLLRWLQLYRTGPVSHDLSVASQHSFRMLYLARMRNESDRQRACKLFMDTLGGGSLGPMLARPWFELGERHVQFGRIVFTRETLAPSDDNFTVPHAHMNTLEHMAAAIYQGWMVILTGSRSAGKTTIARLMASARGVQLVEFGVSSATDSTDLLGGFEQWNEEADWDDLCSRTQTVLRQCVTAHPATRLVAQDMWKKLDWLRTSSTTATATEKLSVIVAECSKIAAWLSNVSSSTSAGLQALISNLRARSSPQTYKGRFKWVDGPVVRAMREGHWLLLDNANLCNSAVLDRLNSVLEDNGRLLLNERGLVDNEIQQIEPHPSFRIIMTMDPQYGELSRAMRNRGVELFVRPAAAAVEDRSRLFEMMRCLPDLPATNLLDATLLMKRLRLGFKVPGYTASGAAPALWGVYDALLFRDSKLARQVLPAEISAVTIRTEPRMEYLLQIARPNEGALMHRVLDHYAIGRAESVSALSQLAQRYTEGSRSTILADMHLPSSFVGNLPFDNALNPLLELLVVVIPRLHAEEFCAQVVPPLELLFAQHQHNASLVQWIEEAGNASDSDPLQHTAQLLRCVLAESVSYVQFCVAEGDAAVKTKESVSSFLYVLELVHALHNIVLAPVWDWSSLRVVSGWFASNSLLSHPCFARTAKVVASLQERLKPRTGVEMFSIWWTTWNRFQRTGLRYVAASGHGESCTEDNRIEPMSPSVGTFGPLTQPVPSLDDFRQGAHPQAHEKLNVGVSPVFEEYDAWSTALAALQCVATWPEVLSHDLLDSLSCRVNDRQEPGIRQLAFWKEALTRNSKRDNRTSARLNLHLTYQWLDSLKLFWTGREYTIDLSPVGIFSAIELQNTVQSLTKPQTIGSMLPYKTALKRQAAYYATVAASAPPSRACQMRALLVKVVQSLCVVFEPSYHADVLARILRFSTLVEDCDAAAGEAWLDDLEATSSVTFAQVMATCLRPALALLFQQGQSEATILHTIANAWVAISRGLIHLYLPDSPSDPLVNITARVGWLNRRKDNLAAHLEMHQESERFVNGQQENRRTSSLQQRLQATEAEIASIEPPPILRPSDPSDINALHGEITQFVDQVMGDQRIDQLLQELVGAMGPATLQRVNMFGRSIDAFIERLRQAYTHLSDVTLIPIVCARMQQMGINIALCAATWQDKYSANEIHSLPISLTQFPAVAGIVRMLDTKRCSLGSASSAPRTQDVILGLALVAEQRRHRPIPDATMDLVQRWYQLLYLRWSSQQTEDELTKAQKDSLYRSKSEDHVHMTDEERAERELRLLFPDFEEDASSPSSTTERDASTWRMDSKAISRIRIIHGMLFPAGDEQSTDWNDLDAMIATLQMEQLGGLDFRQMSDALDAGSHLFRLRCLHQSISASEPSNGIAAKCGDFYWGKNTDQLQKVLVILLDLKARLSILIPLWPEQVQLQDIHTLVDGLLGRSVESPLAQILPVLERLVGSISQWEDFAYRDNSLIEFQRKLVAAIIEWRRIELNSWSRLLDSESLSFAHQTAEWWFLIYGAVVHSPSTGAEQEIKELTSLLDDFMTSSPLGQFEARLQLLASFGTFLRALSRSEHDLKERAELVSSIGTYYGQFKLPAATSLKSQRKPVEEEIRSFVQLASWKDANVEALKLSAKKTHRRLYQSIRKYRGILRQAITPILSSVNSEDKARSNERPAINDFALRPDIAGYVPAGSLDLDGSPRLQLASALARLQGVTGDTLVDYIGEIASNRVELVSTSLIETVEEFRRETASTTSASMQKTLVARKRKAWNDALKEFKVMGFSSRVPDRVLRAQRERHAILRCPNPVEYVFPDDPLHAIIGRTEVYFYKLCTLMPPLPGALVGHHTDMTTRDLQRGLGYVESAFSFALAGRSLLASSCQVRSAMERLLRRVMPLLSTSPSAVLVSFGEAPKRYVQALSSVSANLLSALREILSASELLKAYAPHASLGEHFTGEMMRLVGVQEVLVAQVNAVFTDMGHAHPVIMLSSDFSACEDARRAMWGTHAILSDLRKHHRAYSCLIAPTVDWLREALDGIPGNGDTDCPQVSSPAEPHELSNKLIVSILLVVQQLEAIANDRSTHQSKATSIQHATTTVQSTMTALRLPDVLDGFYALVRASSCRGANQEPIKAALPFVQEYMRLVNVSMGVLANLNKAIFKFTYILQDAWRAVALQGFCKPPEPDERQSEGGAKAETEGTGLGEGTGAEDVSADVDDEAQVEGTRDGRQERDETGAGEDRSVQEDAFEMEQDFEGALEDVMGSASEDNDSSSHEEDVDLEETTGDLDPLDPSTLDEKLWGGGESDKEPEQAESDARAPAKSSEKDDVGARSETTEQKDEPLETEQQSKEGSIPFEGVTESEHSDYMDGGEGVAEPEGLDEDIPVGDALELPDDMQLDEDDGSTSLHGVPENQSPESDDVLEQDERGITEEGSDVLADDDQREESLRADASNTAANNASTVKQADNSMLGDASTASRSEQSGAQTLESSMEIQSGPESTEEPTSPGVMPRCNHSPQIPSSSMPSDNMVTEKDSPGAANQSGKSQGQQEQERHTPDSSPINQESQKRKAGDANQTTIRNMDAVSSPSLDPLGAEGDLSGPMEWLHDDDEAAAVKEQALGPRQEDDGIKLDQLKLEDEPPSEATATENVMDTDTELNSVPFAMSLDHEDVDLERAPTSTMVSQRLMDEAADGSEYSLQEGKSESHSLAKPSVLPAETPFTSRWQGYVSATQDLAFSLCEQLRLILEPTRATRLQGDYKTGKRLNMKKVIPYIASDFTKDKIWLRRTKPSRREYQVLLALDDSRSMAESRSISLALQTLALVSSALGKLEVGDVGIVRFGEEVEVLHDLGQGSVTSQVGEQLISHFAFAQTGTDMEDLLRSSITLLSNARSRSQQQSQTATELWQLEIIISDGVCQAHDRLRSLVRQAEEAKIIIVFIVLDSLHTNGQGQHKTQGSIMSMMQGDYVEVNGRTEIRMNRYMDTFPFNYYIVLRDIGSLPDVLSSTLRQFFEISR